MTVLGSCVAACIADNGLRYRRHEPFHAAGRGRPGYRGERLGPLRHLCHGSADQPPAQAGSAAVTAWKPGFRRRGGDGPQQQRRRAQCRVRAQFSENRKIPVVAKDLCWIRIREGLLFSREWAGAGQETASRAQRHPVQIANDYKAVCHGRWRAMSNCSFEVPAMERSKHGFLVFAAKTRVLVVDDSALMRGLLSQR